VMLLAGVESPGRGVLRRAAAPGVGAERRWPNASLLSTTSSVSRLRLVSGVAAPLRGSRMAAGGLRARFEGGEGRAGLRGRDGEGRSPCLRVGCGLLRRPTVICALFSLVKQ